MTLIIFIVTLYLSSFNIIMKLLQQHITEILILCYLIITFLLSFIEKVFDWKGNVSFIKSHFINSPFKNYVPFLLSIIIFLEIVAVFFMLFGIHRLVFFSENNFALIGLEICALIIIFLLIGQRLAKDYIGASSLTVYFILIIFGIFLLNK